MNTEFKDLKEIAKANNIPTPVGTSTEGLKKILTERGLLKSQKVKTTPEIKKSEVKEKSKMIDIPEDMKHLGLSPVKIKTIEEVEINSRLNTEIQIKLPKSVREKLKREGYKEIFPTEPHVQRIMERGGQFILKGDGTTFKFDSQGCNEQGERIYHIAMKIRNEIIEKEDDLFRARQKDAKKKKEKGEVDESVKKLLKVDPKYLKITEKTNNNL